MESLRNLNQIVTLAECGNFRKAATRLGITHSALSQTVSRMEKELGAPLFVRSHQETIPTAFGSRLLEAAGIAIQELGEAERDITLMQNLEAGRLVIGADPVIADALLAPALANLMGNCPRLRFTVLARNWRNMEEELLARRIDIFVGLAPDRQIESLNYQQLPLGVPVVACRSQHPLATGKPATVDQCLQFPLAGSEAPDWFLEIIVHAFPQVIKSVKDLRSVFLITYSFSVTRRLLLSGDVVAMVPRTMIADDITRGDIVELKVEGLEFPARLPGVVATLGARPIPPAADALIGALYKCQRQAFAKVRKN